MNLLEFQSESDAQSCTDQIASIGKSILESGGYSLDELNRVIGKKKSTGEDAPNSVRTSVWDNVREIDGKFYIKSPKRTYPDYFDQLTEGHSFIEKEIKKEVFIE